MHPYDDDWNFLAPPTFEPPICAAPGYTNLQPVDFGITENLENLETTLVDLEGNLGGPLDGFFGNDEESPTTTHEDLDILNTPIPEDVILDIKLMIECMDNWVRNSDFSKKQFSELVLRRSRRTYYRLVARPENVNDSHRLQPILRRIYNFLKASEIQKAEILNVNKKRVLEVGVPSGEITVAQALEILNQPIPEDVDVDFERILKDVEGWRKATTLSQRTFARKVLGISKSGYCKYFQRNLNWETMRSQGKGHISRMYNWLAASESVKEEILNLNLYENLEIFDVEHVEDVDSDSFDDDMDFEETGHLDIGNLGIQNSEDSETEDSTENPTIGDSEIEEMKDDPFAPAINTIEEAHRILDTPIPDDVTPDPNSILEDVEKWRKSIPTSVSEFTEKILERAPERYWMHLKNPPKSLDNMRSWKSSFVRLYNWSRIPNYQKLKILSFPHFRIQKASPEEPGITIREAFNILDAPIPDDVTPDVKQILEDVEKWHQESGIKKATFARKILGRSRKAYTENLRKTNREWGEIREIGRPIFVRIWNWLKTSDEERMKILKLDLYEKEGEEQENPEDVGNEKSEPQEKEKEQDSPTSSESEAEPRESSQSPEKTTHVEEVPNPKALDSEDVEIPNDHDYTPNFKIHHALQILDAPIPEDVIVNTKTIIEDVDEWRARATYLCVSAFVRKILGCDAKGYHRLLKTAKDFRKMTTWKWRIRRIYNFRNASDFIRWKILGLNEIPKPPEVAEDVASSLVTSFPEVEAILSLEIPDDVVLDTTWILRDVETWRMEARVSQKFFAEKILKRDPVTYRAMLKEQTEWEECRSLRRAAFGRMFNWLMTSEIQKQEILKLVAHGERKRRVSEEDTETCEGVKKTRKF